MASCKIISVSHPFLEKHFWKWGKHNKSMFTILCNFKFCGSFYSTFHKFTTSLNMAVSIMNSSIVASHVRGLKRAVGICPGGGGSGVPPQLTTGRTGVYCLTSYVIRLEGGTWWGGYKV